MSNTSRKLSSDEVSALMEGLQSGEIDSNSGINNDVEVSDFTFGSDNLELLGDYYALRLINERFARLVRSIFLPMIRIQPKINPFPPEVKTYGEESQLKITTKYKIGEEGNHIDDEVQELLFNGLKQYNPAELTIEEFKPGYDGDKKVGVMQSIKVEPTIADDIKTAAGWAILGSLVVIFLYILLRFSKWQYSLGAIVALFHDVLVVFGIFSLFYKILPFDMEIGQSFIAAILTVLGYSINDTVIVFDRIREFSKTHSSWPFAKIINTGLNSTMGRTINTSLTTLLVLIAIFLFGGDSIKGFMFALIVGIGVGTYSSWFIASPILYDTVKKLNKNKK